MKVVKKRVEPKGLGDSLANLTFITGISTLTKKLLGDNCGCAERQEKLNKLLPYNRK